MSDLSAWAQWVAEAVAQTVGSRRCRPTATYRIQFEPGKLTFRDAAGIVPYLDELGISHLYASPYLKARSGSPHGYAIVDYAQLNPELGSEDDYRAMVEALHGHGDGPDSGHRAQSHERDARRKPLVERRAGEWPHLAARRLLRHRLAARQRGTAEQDPPADPGRSVWAGPRIGRIEAGVSRGGVLPALLPVASAARPADLPDHSDAPAG